MAKTLCEAGAGLRVALLDLREAVVDALLQCRPLGWGAAKLGHVRPPVTADPPNVVSLDTARHVASHRAMAVRECGGNVHHFDAIGEWCLCGREYWPKSNPAFGRTPGTVYTTGTITLDGESVIWGQQ